MTFLSLWRCSLTLSGIRFAKELDHAKSTPLRWCLDPLRILRLWPTVPACFCSWCCGRIIGSESTLTHLFQSLVFARNQGSTGKRGKGYPGKLGLFRNKDDRTFRPLWWPGCSVISCSVEEEIVRDQIGLLIVIWSSVKGKRYVALYRSAPAASEVQAPKTAYRSFLLFCGLWQSG
jgi:hypothetical protein